MEPKTPILFDGPQIQNQVEESASLRQQKRPENRKNRTSRRSFFWRHPRKVVLGLSVLCAMTYAAWTVVHFLLYDPRFFLADVTVRGGEYVPTRAVLEKFSPDRQSVFRVPLEDRRAEIEQIPWVRSAVVARVFPNQLVVFLEERAPVAFAWTAEEVYLVDEDGVLLDSPPEARFALPVVRGLSEQESLEQRRVKMQLFMALMKDLDGEDRHWREAISEVDLSDLRDARLVVADSDGAIRLHLGQERFRDRYLIYAKHIEQWKQKFSNIQSVDLRYDEQVVLNADPPNVSPSPKDNRGRPGPSSLSVTPAITPSEPRQSSP